MISDAQGLRVWRAILICLFAITVGESHSHAASFGLFAIENGVDVNHLLSIDRRTGQSTVVAPVGFFSNVTSLAYDPTTDTTFGFDTRDDLLFTIDLTDGTTNLIGKTAQVGGMAIDPLTGDLYGIGLDYLYRIDKNTGTSSQLRFHGFSNALSLAFDPVTRLLYADVHVGRDRRLVSLDLGGGLIETIGEITSGGVIGLDFDPENGKLYGVGLDSPESARLVEIDPTNAFGKVVGPIGYRYANSLVFARVIPEPSTFVILAGLWGLLLSRPGQRQRCRH